MDYKSSGVDIEAGNAFVARLKEKVSTIGGFGGMFKLPTGYEKPILVSGADGVGTKINLCSITKDYTTIGIDLVAMCVNDVICCGAKPLYFLDYISTPKVDHRVDQIMEGIIKGCEIAGCELIGGETAEHPTSKDIDLAGFCTGIVDEDDTILLKISGMCHASGDLNEFNGYLSYLISTVNPSGIHRGKFSQIPPPVICAIPSIGTSSSKFITREEYIVVGVSKSCTSSFSIFPFLIISLITLNPLL